MEPTTAPAPVTGPWPSTLRTGAPAPDFTLPIVDQDRMVSLAEFRGSRPLLLAMFRGIYCPFCRRAIAQMATVRELLQPLGVETLAIVATDLENARLYFRYRPARIPIAVDPALMTHRSYGLPHPPVTPELMEAARVTRINPTGELPEPLSPAEAGAALDRLDGYTPTRSDEQDEQRQFPLMDAQFLIDRDGIIRWVHVECADEGIAGLGKTTPIENIVTAARSLK